MKLIQRLTHIFLHLAACQLFVLNAAAQRTASPPGRRIISQPAQQTSSPPAQPTINQRTLSARLPVTYTFRNLDNTNGLISNEVVSLSQDNRGYMWIGTAKGLQRYDGHRFVNCLETDSNIVEPLPIKTLWPDEQHHRMLFNLQFDHLNQWDYVTNIASTLHPDQVEAKGPLRIYLDTLGRPWKIREYYVEKLRPNTPFRKGDMVVTDPFGKTTFAAFIQIAGKTWINNIAVGMRILDDKTQKCLPHGENEAEDKLMSFTRHAPDAVRRLVGDRQGNIWVVTWTQKLFRYNTIAKKLYEYSITDIIQAEGSLKTLPGWVSSMLEDDHGILWLATSKAGLLQYDHEKDQFSYIIHQPGNNLALQYSHQINDIFQDREGNIWVGTDKGISIFNPYRQFFKRIVAADEMEDKPAVDAAEINAAAVISSGQLLIGQWGNGITVYNRQGARQKHIYFTGEGDDDINLIWSFLQQPDGAVWAGCQHGWLQIIDTAAWTSKRISIPETKGSTILCMIRDGLGNTLLSTQAGRIITWDAKQQKFLPFDSTRVQPGFKRRPIVNMFTDKAGTVWCSTWDGLLEYDPKERRVLNNYKPASVKTPHFYGIIQNDDSTLIVGCETAGLFYFNIHRKTFEKIPVNLDQPFSTVYAVRKNGDDIWFTTDYEICSYNPVTKRFIASQPGKGVINSNFVQNEIIAPADGQWLTYTSAELLGFYPEQINAMEKGRTHITFTGFKLFSEPLQIDTIISKRQPVRLGYKDNFITIEFSNLQFSGVTQTKYYYRLDGVDKDWVFGGTRGSAGYTNLPPGKYTFQVKAANEPAVSSFEIIIAAPYWATIWFRIAIVLLAGLIIYALLRSRIRAIRTESNMKEQIARTEMMALRAQMNPHFIFNCINSIDALIQTNDKYHATVYLNKFARLIRNILDSSRQNTISFTKDLETLRLYIDLEQFRNEHRFSVDINAENSILQDDYKVPPLIIQPYVENAIQHGLRNKEGKDGKLTIDISRQNDHLVYCIEDNGVGREAARNRSTHTSHGLEMSRDRVRLFNGGNDLPVEITDLMTKDGKPAGTKVIVTLKI